MPLKPYSGDLLSAMAADGNAYIPSDVGQTMDRYLVANQFSVGNPVPATDYSGMAGAGIQAAGQMVGMLAQIAGQKAANDTLVAGNSANRASSEKLARLQLAQQADQFGKASKADAYTMLLSALSGQMNGQLKRHDLNRAINRSNADALTTAYLGK